MRDECAPITCVGINGEHGEWLRPPSWLLCVRWDEDEGWGLTMAVSL